MRVPLRSTLLVTASLVVIPALALTRLPRPRAEGLGRLLPHAALLQSFPAGPERTPPQLWQQRLPASTVAVLWRQQRQLWWQFWGRDGAGGVYLVLPLPRPLSTGVLPRPPHSLEVDGLLVVAASPLAERLLRDQLQAAPRQQRGLQQRCLGKLEQSQAAYWSADGLAAMAGPVAPFLQSLQEGCMTLDLNSGGVAFAGEAAAIAGLIAPQPPPPSSPRPFAGRLASPLLLEASGPALEPLVRGLLARQLIREPLLTAYGLSDADLRLLQDTPFLLRLRSQDSGPFQAGLELVLAPGEARARWERMLEGLTDRLVAAGLTLKPGSAMAWEDDRGRRVGGWRWQPGTTTSQQLLQLYLGPEPPALTGTWAQPQAWQQLRGLRVQARPAALANLALLPGTVPRPLFQADQLELVTGPLNPQIPQPTRLQGRLQLPPR